MGRGAFDSNGKTAWLENSLAINTNNPMTTQAIWYENTVAVNEDGDTVQVDLTVANVSDGYLDSSLVVDVIEEREIVITEMQLYDIDDSALGYLSSTAHTYFGGDTRIHGTIKVEGGATDALESIELEILQNGGVVATATLATNAETTLLQAFGEDEEISITTSELLFNFAPQGVDVSNNGTLSLNARATSRNGQEATYDLGTVEILRKFDGTRYGNRDEAEGGDDWAKPTVATFVETYGAGMSWGDFSNMNGGSFPPHGSHDSGNDADGWFDGYNDLNAFTAETIIFQLNSDPDGKITLVFVTYQEVQGNIFYDTIRNVTLDDGRTAISVIRPANGHTTHFHWRIAD